MSNSDPDLNSEWGVILKTIEEAMSVVDQWVTHGRLDANEALDFKTELRLLHATYNEQAVRQLPLPQDGRILRQQPRETSGISGYRLGVFMRNFLDDLHLAGEISDGRYEELLADAGKRLQAVGRRLAGEGLRTEDLLKQCKIPLGMTRVGDDSVPLDTKAVQIKSARQQLTKEETVTPVPRPRLPRRNILEIILDPRSIQYLLGLGGILMVAGLVILLWINNFFRPPVTAIVLASSNLVLLSVGLATMRFTGYQMAGKALSLLACLVMPLNLWYLDGNNLITIDGNLWVCAVLISGIFGLSAVIIRDELFAYVFNAGVTMAGLLIIAGIGPAQQRFWEIASPATLLVVMGLIGIHLERAFSPGEGPISRKRFGMAFFWSGHAQLAAGLLLILGAQISGDWLYAMFFKGYYNQNGWVPSPIVGPDRIRALTLVIGGMYAYVWSDIVVRQKGIFLHLAAVILLWAEVLIVQTSNLTLGLEAMIGILSVTSLISHLAQIFVGRTQPLIRSLPIFGLLLGLLPVLMGSFIFFKEFLNLSGLVNSDLRWSFVLVMLLAAASSRIGAYTYRNSSVRMMGGYFFATGAATMIAVVVGLTLLGVSAERNAPLMMLIPIVYLIASQLYGARSPAIPLMWVAHTAAVMILIPAAALTAQSYARPETHSVSHLILSGFFLEAAFFYALATFIKQQRWCVYPAIIMLATACWQVGTFSQLGPESYLIFFAVCGNVLLIVYRLSGLRQSVSLGRYDSLLPAANIILSVAFVSSAFYELSRFVKFGDVGGNYGVQSFPVSFVVFCLFILAVNGLTILISPHGGGRRWYIVTAVAQSAITLLAIHRLISLTPWQNAELLSILAGLALVVSGHIGWYREQDEQSDAVSSSLLFGSLMLCVPLAIATLLNRYNDYFTHFYLINELGFLLASVALAATGVLLQLRSTTLIGCCMLVLNLMTLPMLVNWERWENLNSVAVAITVCGGFVFGAGLILAFFRDRLLTLPERIKQRAGIFRVLNWR